MDYEDGVGEQTVEVGPKWRIPESQPEFFRRAYFRLTSLRANSLPAIQPWLVGKSMVPEGTQF